MKKLFVLFLAALLVVSMAACAGQNGNSEGNNATDPAAETQAEDEPIDGGWADASSIAVTDEVQAMFDKINETMTGAYYLPIVYLSSQVVAGTNHFVLCKEMPSLVTADAVGKYTLVTVYEDLQGNAEITGVQQSAVTAPQPYDPENPVSGGYGEPESYEPTDEAKSALEKACGKSGDTYEPIALLGTQIVAGTNYMMLCKADPSVSAHSEYVILTVYADLEGNAEITEINDFTAEGGDVSAEDGVSASSKAD